MVISIKRGIIILILMILLIGSILAYISFSEECPVEENLKLITKSSGQEEMFNRYLSSCIGISAPSAESDSRRNNACAQIDRLKEENPFSDHTFRIIAGITCRFGNEENENQNYLYCDREGKLTDEQGNIKGEYQETLVYKVFADLVVGKMKAAKKSTTRKQIYSDGTISGNPDYLYIKDIVYKLVDIKCEKEGESLANLLKGLIFVLVIALLGFIVYAYKDFIFKKKTKQQTQKTEAEVSQKLSGEHIISVSNLNVKFDSATILDNINFKIRPRTLVGIIGPSGMGKSSVMECLVGRKRPTTGNISVMNKKVDEVKNNIGFVPQSPELYMDQSVWQNMINSSIKWGLQDPKKIMSDTLKQTNLYDKTGVLVKDLSGGQTKLLSLSTELIRNPELLVLDEPTTGLDPNSRNQVITMLSRLVTNMQKTVVFSTHFMDDAEQCDEVILIGNKKILAQNSPEKLIKTLPGNGKVLSISLDSISDELLKKINLIEGIIKVISEGKTLKILAKDLTLRRVMDQITDFGGIVTEAKVTKASMMEVFVYYTGQRPE